jgi:glycogen debranching enzyme
MWCASFAGGLAWAAGDGDWVPKPVPRFPLSGSPLAICQAAQPANPFTVTGEWGGVLGEQNGIFETWIFPVKVLSRFRASVELENYPVPIDLNPLAASIEVRPGWTTIVYSHAAFTVRQHMFAPRGRRQPAAPVVFFEVDSVRPMRLVFRFAPEMLRMWPAANFGRPNPRWVPHGEGGYYLLPTDNPRLLGGVALPRATPGVLPPYQERPKAHAVELRMRVDPEKDRGLFFPLLVAVGESSDEVTGQLRWQNEEIARLFTETQNYYRALLGELTSVETPDKRFNDAFRWALVSIDQMRVRHGEEMGLAAGFFLSGDSARPGFGWFFGRDTLWTLYAAHSAGHFRAGREGLEFLIRRQRGDGKIMHEYSQAAHLVDWNSFHYFFASADATPLLPMTMEDYLRASGDLRFLERHWAALKKAYSFVRAHDSDGDGIYENTQGHGWVESWLPRLPFQEVYLAALDQQMCGAMAYLASLLGDRELAGNAAAQARKIAGQLQTGYYDAERDLYQFSRNPDGTYDPTATIFPAVAWWTGRLMLPGAEAMFRRWASAEFSTDWGTRPVSQREKIYDPISYHQGSVWPLFTGWVALAEFRAGRPLAGYQHLMQNVGLTYAQDPGGVTELLSGTYFQPVGRSSSKQAWSSAMVVTPAMRGLFGVEPDALSRTLRVSPQLPLAWEQAGLRNVHIGDAKVDMSLRRAGAELLVEVHATEPTVLCLTSGSLADARRCADVPRKEWRMKMALPPVELAAPYESPAPGARTSQLKVVGYTVQPARVLVTFEAPGATLHRIGYRLNRPGARIRGAQSEGGTLTLRFPPGEGYQTQLVSFEW